MTTNDEKYSERDKKMELLEEKLKNFESIKTELEDYTDNLGKLYQAGIIDEDGNIVSNKDPDNYHQERTKLNDTDMK